MIIDIQHWLPAHIANIDEYQEIRAAYNKILSELMTSAEQVYANRHFDTMDEMECEYWEGLMNIVLDGDETLEERRRNIKGNNASGIPFDERKFRDVLNSMVGADYYTLTIDTTAKTLTVSLTLWRIEKCDYIYTLMREMAPADMVVTVQIVYNRHREFFGYRHSELASYTHSGLRTSTDFDEE